MTIRILEKESSCSLRSKKRASLPASDVHLSLRLRDIRYDHIVFGSAQVAVMTSLNLANEYLKA